MQHDMYLHSPHRDLLGLDTPPHYLKRFQPIHIEDYPETSVFSPVAEAVPTNNHVRVHVHLGYKG